MNNMKYWLQFFAESAADEGGAAGGNAADAGQNNGQLTVDNGQLPPAGGIGQDTGDRIQGTGTPAGGNFTWEDVLARDDMKQHISEIVSQRVGEIRKRYRPMMETLASHHGIAADADGRFNENDIIKAVTNDPAYYDKTAGADGITDPAAARQIAMQMEQARRREQEADEIIRNISTAQHVEKIRREAIQLKQKYPAFDFGKAVENQAFRYYISPQAHQNGHGMTVEQAYLAFYGNDVIQAAAGNVAKSYASAAASNRNFPEENRDTRQNSAGIPQKKFSEMTDEEFAEVKRQVQSGKYRFN